MAERMHIPSTPECGAWETQLADALDGLLNPEEEAKFAAHKAGCPACAALCEEAQKGREWLEFLGPEPEPPAGLLDKILAKTGPGQQTQPSWFEGPMPAAAGPGPVPGFVPAVWQQPGIFERVRQAMQPRLIMTTAMAFFSIALTLNITGFTLAKIHVTPLRLADLRPRTMRALVERQLTMASVPIVRYYDHLRFVYEVQARVRELRGETENGNGEQRKEAQPKPGETQQIPRSKDGDLREDPQEGTGDRAIAGSSQLLESSLTNPSGTERRNAAQQPCKRSTVWIA
jgi:hypothetical protein